MPVVVPDGTDIIAVPDDDEGCSPFALLDPDDPEELVDDDVELDRLPTSGCCSLADEDEDELLRLVLPEFSSAALTAGGGAAAMIFVLLLADEPPLVADDLSFPRLVSAFDSAPPYPAVVPESLRFTPPSINETAALVTTAVAHEVAVLTTELSETLAVLCEDVSLSDSFFALFDEPEVDTEAAFEEEAELVDFDGDFSFATSLPVDEVNEPDTFVVLLLTPEVVCV